MGYCDENRWKWCKHEIDQLLSYNITLTLLESSRLEIMLSSARLIAVEMVRSVWIHLVAILGVFTGYTFI